MSNKIYRNILISGPPGCGKSTLIERIGSGIKVPVAGFITREIRERGKRVGFSMETFDGKKGTLAHVNITGPVRVGKYGVSIEVLEAMAVPSLSPGSAEVLVIIDEIGKMECFSPLFQSAVLNVLDSSNPVLASIAQKGNAFIEDIKSRGDVELYSVDIVNRDLLAVSIINELRALFAR